MGKSITNNAVLEPQSGDRPTGKMPAYPAGDAGSNPSSPLQVWAPDLLLEFCKATDPRYEDIRKGHYVQVKGSHQGQQVCFLIWYRGKLAGIISGASPVLGTACRDTFFGITKDNRYQVLNGVIDNVIFRLVNHEQNLGSRVLVLWEKAAVATWENLYQVEVFGFETFVVREGQGIVRHGSVYRASNWTFAGEIRQSMIPTKDVYCRWRAGYSMPVGSEYQSSWRGSTPAEKTRAKQLTAARKELLGTKFYLKAGKLQTRK